MTEHGNESTNGSDSWPQGWEERIGSFAEAVGHTIAEVTAALAPLTGTPGPEALDVLSSEEYSPFEDLRDALKPLSIPSGLLRKNVTFLRGQAHAGRTSPAGEASGPMLDVLPTVPDDSSFVAALKVGGDLKIGPTEVIAAMKASLANKVGLFNLPALLQRKMEEWSEQNDEPCSQSWYEIRRLVARREYAPVLNALGLEGHFVSQKRKELFFQKIDSGLWPALHRFQQQLKGWQEAWLQGASNPGVMLAALGVMGENSPLPPGILQPPSTDFLRDAAESVIDQINKAFAGTGIPIARALAYEAQQVKDVLSDERLPATIGATTREQMLKMLDADVSADYVRLERSVVRYALSIMELPSVPGGRQELLYFSALLQLGAMITWDKLL